MRITRHFEAIDGRQIHYRRCGSGPALVMLHASPVSSKVFEPAMRIFGRHFTCFAFDTPGNGLSDPLAADDPDLNAYAVAQAALLRQLGVEQAILYGRHTGASIVVEMVRIAPDLASMVMTDGYPVFTPEQRDQYLSGYLNDLPVSEDGSHVPWLWNRYRDQFAFWPWNKRDEGFRADCDMPDLDFVHNGVVALMEAGNNYKAPYRAVFKFDAMAALPGVSVPLCISARPGDSLHRKFGDFPDDLWKVEMPRDFAQACAEELAIFLEKKPTMDAPPVPAKGTRGFASVGPHDVHFIHGGSGDSKPTVLIGPAPGSVAPELARLDPSRPVIALDPLCAGESSDGPTSADQQAAVMLAALDQLGATDFDLAGIGSGGAIALEMARSCPDAAITLIDPLLVPEDQRALIAAGIGTDCSLQRDGTHMMRIWQTLRDAMMWFPHFDQRRSAMRGGAAYDWERLEVDFLSHLKHCHVLQDAWQAAWAYPIQERLADFDVRTQMVFTHDSLVPPAIHGQNLSDAKEAL